MRYEDAIKWYRHAISIAARGLWIYYNNLGLVYHRAKQYNNAIEAFDEVIRRNPGYENVYNSRGNVYRDLLDFQRALADYNQSIIEGCKRLRCYRDRAWIYLYLALGEEAAADAQKYIDKSGWRDEDAPYLTFIYYFGKRQANRDKEARKLIEESINKIDAKAWTFSIAQYLRKEIKADDLIKLATDNDKMTEARAYIGLEQSLSGNRDEALTNLRWVKENGNQDFYEYHLAVSELRRIGTPLEGT